MQNFDIAIIGGGLNGIALAASMPKHFKIALIDFKDITKPYENSHDGRNIAISSASVDLLKKAELWNEEKLFPSPIKHIIVNDDYSKPVLQFDQEMLNGSPIGNMVVADDLIRNFQIDILCRKNIETFPQHDLHNFTSESNKVLINLRNQKDNIEISAKLLIGADGKNSKVREKCNIETFGKPYGQDAIICNITHEQKHQNIAHEIFFPNGPLAILPLKNENESSIVLCQKSNIAKSLLQDPKLLNEILQEKCHFLGSVEISSKIMSYPLILSYAKEYTKNRIALVGDAIHAIHPIAGQGFNLGLQDVKAIVSLITEYDKLGLDFGGMQMLEQYQKERRSENRNMILITDSFNWLFSNNSLILKNIRRFGLDMVSKMPFLKKTFMKYASKVK